MIYIIVLIIYLYHVKILSLNIEVANVSDLHYNAEVVICLIKV